MTTATRPLWEDLSALDRWELERCLRFACIVAAVARGTDERRELERIVGMHRDLEHGDPTPEYMRERP